MQAVDINRIGTIAPGASRQVLDADLSSPIAEAWVVDPRARAGDALVDDPIPPMDTSTVRLRRQLVAMPGPIEDLESRLARLGAADDVLSVVRICPGAEGHGYPLEQWALAPMPEYCEREELALLVDPGHGAASYPWDAIVRLARDHPRLVVVALAAPLFGPTAGRALDAAPNLVLETSHVGGGRSSVTDIGRLAGVCGAYRLAYGSGDLHASPAGVEYELAPEVAEIVLSGTARAIDQRQWASTYL